MKNRTVIETFQALAELNNMKLPAVVAYRIGVNLNAIRVLWHDVEEVRKKLVAEHEVDPSHPVDKEYEARLKEFTTAWEAILDEDVEWTPKTTFPLKLVENVKEFNNTAQLIAAGILTE